MDRRDFIKMLGIAGVNATAYAACSSYMREALAGTTVVNDLLNVPLPHCQNGSLKDIEHIVILMQENRSFDHYFGTLRGVRGFGDPRPLTLKDGDPVWLQAQEDATAPKIRPYRLPKNADSISDSAGDVFLQDPAHDYDSGLGAWNNGLMDSWIPNKDIVAMAHYVEEDIPLYFKLAKNFTICDANFCSLNGPTDPNRSYFWTGTSQGKTSNSYFSGGGGPADWGSYPEKLELLGIDWKFYQDGLHWTFDDAFAGNYGDNTLEYFAQYKDETTSIFTKNQSVNSVLRTSEDVPSQFEQDVSSGTLPAISWIVAPEAFCEHPKFPPHFGEYYLHEIIRALAGNKEVWHKTALFITYDENGGFFDHVPPPSPPLNSSTGLASPGIVLTPPTDAFDANSEYAPDGGTPLGMGARVPLLVISQWSSGGRVCSEVFDHTSFIRFLDTWLSAKGKQEENSPVFPAFSSWRQAISGDLTSTFDFNRQSTSEFDALIDPSQAIRIFTEDEKNTARDQGSWWGGQGLYPSIDTVNLDPEINSPTAKKQDVARCDILPIGYDFQVFANFATVEGVKKLNLTFRNCGKLGVAFYVYSYEGTQVKPRVYSVEGGEGQAPLYLADALDADGDKGAYRYVVHGPNGYLSEFRGMSSSGTQAALADVVDVQSIADGQAVRFLFGKWPTANGKLKMVDAYSSAEADINVGGKSIDVPTKDGWYDASFVDGTNDSTYLRRYAGHLENGKISRSDPAIGLIYDDVKRIYQPAAMS